MPYVRLPYLVALLPLAAACGDGGASAPDRSASMAGRIAIAGQSSVVVGASVAIDQVRVDDGSGAVREHIGDAVSDADGRYEVGGFGERNGLFLVTASGGSFRDLVSGETVELDPSDQIRTLITLDLFEERTDALVSGVGHLTEVLARQRLAAGLHPDLYEAREFAAAHLDAHYGALTWQRIDPASLDAPATSATDPVRAGLVAESWAILSNEIATSAGASPQEVNVYSLMEAWATDLSVPPFDGQDNNNNANGSGIQLGECPAVPDSCIPTPPPPACSLGSCRSECDLYGGSPRAALSGALLKLVRSEYNQTGITDTAVLPLARAMAENTDEVLFSGCVDNLDRSAPSIFFEIPSPADGAFVRGTISVRVRAVDDIDIDPDLVLLNDLVDGDGDDSNAVATAEVSATTDGPLTVEAKATDAAGNSSMTSRTFNFDNTDPLITIAPTGFYVQDTDWWTDNAMPTIGGTITEANLDTISVYADGLLVGAATVTSNSWSFILPAGTVPGVTGVDVRVTATDRAGGTASVTQRIRYDATSPDIATPDVFIADERADDITFSTAVDPLFNGPGYEPTHRHSQTIGATLGPAHPCDATAPDVYKYTYLLDASPPFVTEAMGTGGGARNQLRWAMSITDDGVGVDYSTVQYRLHDVAAGTFPLDWTSIGGTGSYTVHLYRDDGQAGPDVPILGSKEGFFEIQFRGRDRLGHEVTATRCWDHHLIAPPVYILGSAGDASPASNGPDGSAVFALDALRLDDTVTPLDPVSMMMNLPGVGQTGGAGLVEFSIVNPTAEAVYVSIDLDDPTTGRYAKRWYENSWIYSETSSSTNCGNDGQGGPNESLPNCAPVAYPGGASIEQSVVDQPIDPTSYSIRAWEIGSVYNETLPCTGCSTTPPGPLPQTRVTFLLGPRAIASAPRRWVVMPVLKPLSQFAPGGFGPYTEVAAGGGHTVSGKNDETRTGCHRYTPSGVNFICTTRRTYRRLRYVSHLSTTNIGAVKSTIRTSWGTGGGSDPPHLQAPANVRARFAPNWTTDEIAIPLQSP